jgi:hypothetical protein
MESDKAELGRKNKEYNVGVMAKATLSTSTLARRQRWWIWMNGMSVEFAKASKEPDPDAHARRLGDPDRPIAIIITENYDLGTI